MKSIAAAVGVILVVWLSVCAQLARAGYASGFENPPFTLGAINGKDSWGGNGTIVAAVGNPGQCLRDSFTGFVQLTRAGVFDNPPPSVGQRVQFDFLIETSAAGQGNNAVLLDDIVLFGPDVSGHNNKTDFVYDSRTSPSGTMTNNRFTLGALASPDTVSLNQWYHVIIDFDFSTVSGSADALVTLGGVTYWDPAPVALTLNGNKNYIQPTISTSAAVSSSFLFDNLSFTAVPEPAACALLALGGLVLVRRRT